MLVTKPYDEVVVDIIMSNFENSHALFEISWEVCNKVGGIHTVIASKTRTVKKYFNNYYAIGPYFGDNQREFERKEIPVEFVDIFNELESMGIKIHYGSWLIDNSIDVFLVEYMGYASHANEIKGKIWEIGQVDSLGSNWYDFDEVMLWSWCVGILIDKLSRVFNNQILVHAHEWMSGGTIFYMKSLEQVDKDYANKFKTIFTTHATMLGRAMSGNHQNLYNLESDESFDPLEEAIKIGVKTKFQTEKALAKVSDIFTTVSDITGDEAEVFLKKRPDVLLYNGFDNPLFEMVDNFYLLYEKSREVSNNFLNKYFSRFYDINLDNTQVFFTSGRNEFRTKGIDVLVKSLSNLNNKLKENQDSKDVICLFLIPIGDFEVDQSLIGAMEDDKFKRSVDFDFAPLSTHNVPFDNQYIKNFIENGLCNNKNDKVKVILMPFYLNGGDGILNYSYYDLILGLDLGIFPSYYEPWGYTPLECISYGVPSITSNLAGFGRAVNKNYSSYDIVKVLNRESNTDEQAIDDLTNTMLDFTRKDAKDLFASKTRAKVFADKFSWSSFYDNYLTAYEKALKK